MSRYLRWFLAMAWLAGVSACGGGGGGGGGSGQTGGSVVPPPPSTPVVCSLEDQQAWLRSHVRQDYLWNLRAPDPAPSGFSDLRSYFNALLFSGDTVIPKDRYSGYSATVDYDLYYDEGKTLGFGLAVAGQEVLGQPKQPLWIRYVEPNSPAALADLRRGDRVVSLNGVSAEQVIATENFSALVAALEGDALAVRVERGGQVLERNLVARTYNLSPVLAPQILAGPSGQAIGYLYLHAFLMQAEPALDEAFSQFARSNLSELVIDLRYNTGGFVNVSERLASLVGGQSKAGLVYVDLIYNANNRRLNTRYRFTDRLAWPGLRRVYVIAGQRTCSASEQLIWGLKGAGVEVIQVGGTTCGKPVGFNARSYCGNTFSIVMFESLNSQGVGGYYAGLPPSCQVDEDWSKPLGDPSESLLKAALQHAATGQCPIRAAQRKPSLSERPQWPWVEPLPPPTMR